jgi:citrate lyase beta subunit
VISHPSQNSPLAYCRSFLFVPGIRPERFRKALAAGADLVCIDLEAAVAAGPAKDAAPRLALEEEFRRSARVGFVGKAAIHPSQLAPIHRAFAPSQEQIGRARAVVDAYERMSGGVAPLDGKLIERPVYLAATRLLSAAEFHHGEQ